MQTVWTLAVNEEFVLSCGTFSSVKFCDYKVWMPHWLSKINSLVMKGPFNFCIRFYCALCLGWELLKPVSNLDVSLRVWCGTVPNDQLNVLVKRGKGKREVKGEEWVALTADTCVMYRFLGPILLITAWSPQDGLQAVLQSFIFRIHACCLFITVWRTAVGNKKHWGGWNKTKQFVFSIIKFIK